MDEYKGKTTYQVQDVADAYEDVRFTSFCGRMYDKCEKRAVLKALSVFPKGAHILDLACGTGRFSELLLDHGYKVTGADISEAMLEKARAKLQSRPNVSGFYRRDAEDLGFEEGEFDGVVSIRLFGHLPPPVRKRVLEELKRVCAKEFIIAFYVLNPLTRLRRSIRNLPHRLDDWYPVPMRGLVKELDEVGLKILRRFHVIPWVDQGNVFLLGRKDA